MKPSPVLGKARPDAGSEFFFPGTSDTLNFPCNIPSFPSSLPFHCSRAPLRGGTWAAFKYLDDSAMGVDLTVKQIVHVVRGRRKVLRWLGNPPKRRGRIAKFFFRIGVTNKWTRIVLSYRVSVERTSE